MKTNTCLNCLYGYGTEPKKTMNGAEINMKWKKKIHCHFGSAWVMPVISSKTPIPSEVCEGWKTRECPWCHSDYRTCGHRPLRKEKTK